MCNFQGRVVRTLSILSEEHITSVQQHVQQPTNIDYNKVKPYFGQVNADMIKKTFEIPLNGQSYVPDFHEEIFQV